MGMTVTYSDFPILTPASNDPAVGGVAANGNLYCRHCMYRLGIDWTGMKYITNSRAKLYILNCVVCGWRIMKKRMYKNV